MPKSNSGDSRASTPPPKDTGKKARGADRPASPPLNVIDKAFGDRQQSGGKSSSDSKPYEDYSHETVSGGGSSFDAGGEHRNNRRPLNNQWFKPSSEGATPEITEQLEESAQGPSRIAHHLKNIDTLPPLTHSGVSTPGSDGISTPETPVGKEGSGANPQILSELLGASGLSAEMSNSKPEENQTRKLMEVGVLSPHQRMVEHTFPYLGEVRELPPVPDLPHKSAIEFLTRYSTNGTEVVEHHARKIYDEVAPRLQSEHQFNAKMTGVEIMVIKNHINAIRELPAPTSTDYRIINASTYYSLISATL